VAEVADDVLKSHDDLVSARELFSQLPNARVFLRRLVRRRSRDNPFPSDEQSTTICPSRTSPKTSSPMPKQPHARRLALLLERDNVSSVETRGLAGGHRIAARSDDGGAALS
jgi:hypothetical protein